MAKPRPRVGVVYRRRGESFQVKVTALEASGPRCWVCFRRVLSPGDYAAPMRSGLVMFQRRYEEVPRG